MKPHLNTEHSLSIQRVEADVLRDTGLLPAPSSHCNKAQTDAMSNGYILGYCRKIIQVVRILHHLAISFLSDNIQLHQYLPTYVVVVCAHSVCSMYVCACMCLYSFQCFQFAYLELETFCSIYLLYCTILYTLYNICIMCSSDMSGTI